MGDGDGTTNRMRPPPPSFPVGDTNRETGWGTEVTTQDTDLQGPGHGVGDQRARIAHSRSRRLPIARLASSRSWWAWSRSHQPSDNPK